MAPAVIGPRMSKTIPRTRKKKQSCHRSSIARDLFRQNVSLRDAGRPRMLNSKSPNSSSNGVKTGFRHTYFPHSTRHYKQHNFNPEGEDCEEGADPFRKLFQNCAEMTSSENEEGPCIDESSSNPCESESEGDEQDWLDGSTIAAPYKEELSETEEDRTLALVEYLQVPMQEKSQEIKQDLCNMLDNTMNEIRQAHHKLERGADIDRGKGIVEFNGACDQRHINTSRAHAELEDTVANNQAEIGKLFDQLKQGYTRRSQLWDDLRAGIGEITKLQTALLDQLDGKMARTVAALDKKGKAFLKDEGSKNKEKFLRGVLGKF